MSVERLQHDLLGIAFIFSSLYLGRMPGKDLLFDASD